MTLNSTLTNRQQALLRGLIEGYITEAKPVASQQLLEKLGLDLSSATIRNELKELEEAGLVTSPHTSAGRIPTEDGYRYFLEHFLDTTAKLDAQSQSELEQLAGVVSDQGEPGVVKQVMKGVATKANEAILLSLGRSSFYYTGISNLFNQPEFQTVNEMAIFSNLIDHLDEVMGKLHTNEDAEDITIYVGSDNPVSAHCSALVMPYQYANSVRGTVALLGPMRMDYQYNYELLKYTKHLLTKTL